MNHRTLIGLTIGILLILAAIFIAREKETPSPAIATESEPSESAPGAELGPDSPSGDQFLTNYADPHTPPAEDLEKFGRALEGMLLLFKNLDTRHIATNEQLAAFLKGENPEKLSYLSPESVIFDSEGLMIDRWGTPLFIHPISTGMLGVRSAGPDRQMHTEDDLVRDPDGMIHTP